MFSWISRVFSWASGQIDSTVNGLINDVLTGLYGFLHTLFGMIIEGWGDLYNGIQSFDSEFTSFATIVEHGFNYIVRMWIPSILSWINTTIVKPLLGALAWIANEGATVWHYISNPADLADLIFDALIAKIEATAWTTAGILGKFALSLVVRNLTQFLTLAEDILDALL